MKSTKRVASIIVLLLLPFLLVMFLFSGLREAGHVVAAAPAAPDDMELQWSDDFESYEPGSTYTEGFPAENWTHSGLRDMFVYTDTYHSPDQSLKGHGIFGDCGGSVAYRPIGGYAPMEVEVWIRNGNPTPMELTGCHPVYGALELSTQPSWEGQHRGLLGFFYEEDNVGNPLHRIYGGGFEVDEPYPGEDLLYLQDYTLATWYKVKVRYEVVDSETVRLTYWINDVQRGQHELAVRPFEGQLAYLGLWVGEGVAWHDDVVMYASEEPIGTDLSLTKTANPRFVESGASFSYQLTVVNNGPLAATDVQLEDTLPAGVGFVSATASQGSCSQSGGTISCSLGELANGASATVNIGVTAPATNGRVVNQATVTHAALELSPGDNTAEAEVLVGFGVGTYLPVVLKR